MSESEDECPHCQLSRDPDSEHCQCGIGYDEKTREELLRENARLRLRVSTLEHFVPVAPGFTLTPGPVYMYDLRLCYDTETGELRVVRPGWLETLTIDYGATVQAKDVTDE
jgi:hypothetical protein